MPQQKLLPVPQLFYLLLLPVVLLFPLSGRSQAKGQGYTLKQAIDYALLKNASVKNALLDVDASKAKIGEVISSGLPQVNAGVNYSHNIQIQNVVLENGASAIASSTSLPKGAVIAFPFQLYNVGFGAITLNQMIFNGTFLVGLKAAETYKELSTKALKASKITVASNVSKAYYGVLVTDERISLLEKNINRLDSTYRETKEMFKNGFVEKIDVDRVEVALNNLKSEQLTAQRTREVTVTLLKFQMGMEISEPITLTDRLRDIKTEGLTPYTEKSFDYNKRIEYSQLLTARRLNELDLLSIKSGYLPTINASASYGSNTASSHFSDFFDFGSRWFPYSLVGVSINVPIFDGFNKHYRAQQSKISAIKTENTISQTKMLIDAQLAQSNTGVQNSLDRLNTQRRNYDLATEVSRVTKIKYQQGVGSNIEVTNAEAALKEAQTNYYAALYDLLIAKVDLDVASGSLLTE